MLVLTEKDSDQKGLGSGRFCNKLMEMVGDCKCRSVVLVVVGRWVTAE